jgi:hypothetical protein
MSCRAEFKDHDREQTAFSLVKKGLRASVLPRDENPGPFFFREWSWFSKE